MRPLFLLLFACILFSKRITAQSTNASFIGVVATEGNEPLAGATVDVVNESTGFSTSTTSQKDGGFQLMQLPLGGPYTLRASYIGYIHAGAKRILSEPGRPGFGDLSHG
jgi:hypothetical protein